MDKHLGPASPMDYIFSHFTGIFATSTVWFVLYCCCTPPRRRPSPSLRLQPVTTPTACHCASA
jgi:hypothetical protein